MKSIQAASPEPAIPSHPDFCHWQKRISREQMAAVKRLGKLILRPIRPGDESEMVRFHQRISDETIYMRYFQYLGFDWRTAHDRLVEICTNQPDSYAIVVERAALGQRLAAIIAVGRLTKSYEPYVAAFDMLIADDAQVPKLAKLLLARLIKIADAFGFRALTRDFLVADHDTLNLCRTLGFSLQTHLQDGLVRVILDLGKSPVR